jgi:hypothetical protein
MGYIIATPGNVIDYDIIEETINTTYHLQSDPFRVRPLQCHTLIQGLQEQGLNVSEFSQAIGTISHLQRSSKS